MNVDVEIRSQRMNTYPPSKIYIHQLSIKKGLWPLQWATDFHQKARSTGVGRAFWGLGFKHFGVEREDVTLDKGAVFVVHKVFDTC